MPKRQITIRVAIELDLLQLVTVARKYYDEAPMFNRLQFDSARAVHFAARAVEDPFQQIFLAFDGNKLLGFLWGGVAPTVWSPDLVAYDQCLYVLKEKRNFFVASKLVKAFEEWATYLGAKIIHVGMNSGIHNNRTAQAFYTKLGYSPGGGSLYKEIKEETDVPSHTTPGTDSSSKT